MIRGDFATLRRTPAKVGPVRGAPSKPSTRRDAASGLTGPAITEAKLKPVVGLLVVSLFIPWTVPAGSFAISPYRVVLLIAIIPCLIAWSRGKAGRIRLPDLAILAYAVCCVASLSVNHGLEVGIKSGGVQLVETVGAYFVARCFIRSAEDFRRMCRLLFIMIMILLPFAIVEWLTGQNLLLEVFSAVLPTTVIYRMPPRLGLERVQSVFEHPILFGVCVGSMFALTFAVLGWQKSLVRRWTTTGLVGLAVVTSLSSGPISAVFAQAMLLTWGWIMRPFRARWKILLGLILLGLLVIELFAHRPLPNVLLSSVALDPESAYYRVLIWNFGFQSALNHPLFGVGFGRWDHPDWMTQSIDMFWLYHAIVFGLPAAVLMLLTFFSALILVGAKKGLNARLYSYRMGYLICMVGFFIVGWTVHFWNATYVLFLFLLGSGIWLLDTTPQAAQANDRDASLHLKRRALNEPSARQRERVGPASGRSVVDSRP